MNWPHAQSHCEPPVSEKRLTPESLNTRSLTARAFGPTTMEDTPLAYAGGATRRYCVPARPHVGWLRLLFDPSIVRMTPTTAVDPEASVVSAPPTPGTAATTIRDRRAPSARAHVRGIDM